MSITAETAKAHAHDPAVLCCRAEAGITIEPANLEDPAIFDDLVDSGLLSLDGCLTIEEVLGATLTKTCDSLCPLTADVLDGVKAPSAPEAEVAEEAEEAPAVAAPVAAAPVAAGGTLKIHIGEGKDIDLEIPVGALAAGGAAVAAVPAAAEAAVAGAAAPAAVEEEKVIRTLTRKHFTITEVKRGPETKIEGTTLYIREGIEADVIADQELVKDFHLEIITPENYHTYSETIMDVQPIATKEGDADLGTGVTRVLDGVVMMLTGTDEDGVQIGEFGSSEGYLDENIMWNRPGCPDKGEIFIKGNIVIQEKTNMERRGPMAAHTAFDIITQEIREVMKELDESLVTDTEELKQVRRPGRVRGRRGQEDRPARGDHLPLPLALLQAHLRRRRLCLRLLHLPLGPGARGRRLGTLRGKGRLRPQDRRFLQEEHPGVRRHRGPLRALQALPRPQSRPEGSAPSPRPHR